jgi:PEP-CTERM motif
MKIQGVNQPTAQWFCKQDRSRTTTQLWQRLLTVALMMSALLLAGSIAVQAQSPPSTYNAQSDGFGFPGDPATTASGSSGLWNFTATMPAAYQYQSQEIGCQQCLQEYDWSYDYHAGGSFTLLGPGYTFNGIFNSGYGYGESEDGGPDEEGLTLDMYFTGQWNGPNGPKDAGFMRLVEGGFHPYIEGTATLSFAPAPEPGSILLLGSGILGLAGMLRRRLLR